MIYRPNRTKIYQFFYDGSLPTPLITPPSRRLPRNGAAYAGLRCFRPLTFKNERTGTSRVWKFVNIAAAAFGARASRETSTEFPMEY